MQLWWEWPISTELSHAERLKSTCTCHCAKCSDGNLTNIISSFVHAHELCVNVVSVNMVNYEWMIHFAVQRQNAVSAYFTSKQILHFGFYRAALVSDD